MRARWRLRVLVSLLALTGLLATAGAHTDELERRYEQTQDQLESARRQLQSVEAEIDHTESDLRAADEQLVQSLAKLSALEERLAAAQTSYDEARARSRAATDRLQAVTGRLDRVRGRLQQRRDTFANRVAATYKYGAAGYLEVLLEARDVSDLAATSYKLRAVLDMDRSIIEDIRGLEADLNERRARLAELRSRARREEARAAELRDEVRGLTQERRELTERVREERAERERILRAKQADKAEYERLVADLQAESRELAQELAESRWRAGAPGEGELAWPTDGRAGSGFGWRTHPIFGTRRLHAGVDVGGPTGQPIVAAADGRVVHAGWRGGYGMAVVIDHGGGLATLYAHQSAVLVDAGEVVSRGQQVGRLGSTGWSTGPHLHFEVRVNGEPRDPMNWY